MTTIYVDGIAYEVPEGRNLLQAVLSVGLNLEYFCWHPALNSVGACRQCAVMAYKDEESELAGRGKLVMACMTPATDGTRISIKALDAVAFRKSVIEWLMVNHPHDCPVCDEGGECHLQDMTYMTGHTYREYRFTKRTHRNQDLGPFINHEMNRCIACYRCVRFYRDFAGGDDLDVFGAHDHVYFGRREDGVLQSEFAGNLVEVCPTGVFTDKTAKHNYTRKWDMISAPSVCHHCSVGCNTIVNTRNGETRRVINRYNREVNGYFLCDRGRFGYDFMNSGRLVREARVEGRVVSSEEGVARAAELIERGRVLGIGSPRASLEGNFAVRQLVGPENFCSGMDQTEHVIASRVLEIFRHGPVRAASLHDIEQSDSVLVLGEDLTNTAPMMDYAVRQAARNQPIREAVKTVGVVWLENAIREQIQDQTGPVFVATPAFCKLDAIARQTFRGAPDEIALLGFAVAHELDPKAPHVKGLPESMQKLAASIAQDLREAERPAVITGSSLRTPAIVEAAASVANALQGLGRSVGLAVALSECNSLGAAFCDGMGWDEAVKAVEEKGIDTLVVLENGLFRRADTLSVEQLLAKTAHLIVLDHLESATTPRASILLPVAPYAAAGGTLINSEGRAQRFFQALPPQETSPPESWRWVRDIMERLGREEAGRWHNLDDINRAACTGLTKIGSAIEPAPEATYRVVHQRIPRAPHRYSGRTAEMADRTVHEAKPPVDVDTPLAFSMEGYQGRPPSPALIPFFWSPGWNSVQATTKYQQEAGGHLRGGDPGVRLLKPKQGVRPAYASEIPVTHTPKAGEWLAVPLYHIYGSEPMSAASPPVATLVPEPYVLMNADDVGGMQAEAGAIVRVKLGDEERELPVVMSPSLPRGLVGIPVGIAGSWALVVPQKVTVAPGETA